jgi:hypothetical protein
VGLVDELQTKVPSVIPEYQSLKDEMLVEIGLLNLFNQWKIFICKLYQQNQYKIYRVCMAPFLVEKSPKLERHRTTHHS